MYLDISANSGDVDGSVFDYVKGIDYVVTADVGLLATIGENRTTAAFGIKDNAVGVIEKITVVRTEVGNEITFTVKCKVYGTVSVSALKN